MFSSKIYRSVLIAAAIAMAGCEADDPFGDQPVTGIERIAARPIAATTNPAAGTYPLGVTSIKDAQLVVPTSVTPNAALPLLVMLHGAGGDELPLEPIIEAAEQFGVALLLPKSRQTSWDVARGGFGEDIRLIDQALAEAFKRVRVDASRIAVAGFSDGASYALSIGLANGDLFTHVIAFGPGFMTPVTRVGNSRYFIAHGRQDGVTSARNTADNFIPFLRTLGYTVQFVEFDGGHQVRAVETEQAFRWFLDRPSTAQ